jgi:hypothetical protein
MLGYREENLKESIEGNHETVDESVECRRREEPSKAQRKRWARVRAAKLRRD